MTDQPGLFDEPTQAELHPGQGKCPLCHRPQMWRPRLQEWSRFCGSGQCNSQTRICQNCSTTFQVGIHGAGTKYCSAQCRYDKNFLYQQRNYADVTCAWCNQRAKYRTRKRQGEYVCNECIEPIKHVWVRLEKHHVPIEMRRRLVLDPSCDICGTKITMPADPQAGRSAAPLHVDHDHQHCPGPVSCGECVRGFLCKNCNPMLGLAGDSIEALEQAAAYLRTYRTKLILKENDHGNERS